MADLLLGESSVDPQAWKKALGEGKTLAAQFLHSAEAEINKSLGAIDVKVTQILASKDAEIRRLEREKTAALDEVNRLTLRSKVQGEQLQSFSETIKSTTQLKQDKERESQELQKYLAQKERELQETKSSLTNKHQQSSTLEQQTQLLSERLRISEEKSRKDIEQLTAQVAQLQKDRQEDAVRYTRLTQEMTAIEKSRAAEQSRLAKNDELHRNQSESLQKAIGMVKQERDFVRAQAEASVGKIEALQAELKSTREAQQAIKFRLNIAEEERAKLADLLAKEIASKGGR